MKSEINVLITDHDEEIAEMRNDVEIRKAQLEYYGIEYTKSI